MSEHGNRPEADDRLRELIRGLPVLRPDPAFRDRLRAMFVEDAPAAAPREASFPAAPSRRGLWSAVAGLAAAAAVAVLFLTRPAAPVWTVAEASATARIGDRTLPAADLPGMKIEPGTVIEAGSDGLCLSVSDCAVLELAGGTRVRVGTERAGFRGIRLTAEVLEGTALGTTGPDFPGLQILTDHARITVRGTTFAVLRERELTCVCLLEGTVEVSPLGGAPYRVRPEHQYFVHAPGTEPHEEDLTPEQRENLVRVRDRGMLSAVD